MKKLLLLLILTTLLFANDKKKMQQIDSTMNRLAFDYQTIHAKYDKTDTTLVRITTEFKIYEKWKQSLDTTKAKGE
jgi:hypothetical protein